MLITCEAWTCNDPFFFLSFHFFFFFFSSLLLLPLPLPLPLPLLARPPSSTSGSRPSTGIDSLRTRYLSATFTSMRVMPALLMAHQPQAHPDLSFPC